MPPSGPATHASLLVITGLFQMNGSPLGVRPSAWLPAQDHPAARTTQLGPARMDRPRPRWHRVCSSNWAGPAGSIRGFCSDAPAGSGQGGVVRPYKNSVVVFSTW